MIKAVTTLMASVMRAYFECRLCVVCKMTLSLPGAWSNTCVDYNQVTCQVSGRVGKLVWCMHPMPLNSCFKRATKTHRRILNTLWPLLHKA